MIGWRIALLIPLALPSGSPGSATGSTPYSFTEAVDRGVVDFVASPWSPSNIAADVAAIGKLGPGLVNRLGFEYGGMSETRLEFSGKVASDIHGILPRARIGGGFPENLRADYRAVLPCDSETDRREFSRKELTQKTFDKRGNYWWIDVSLGPAQDYYICIGKAQIRRQFSHLHFEEADNILANCASLDACIDGYRRVQAELLVYAKKAGIELSFSGEPKLAHALALNAVYIPARFYIDDFDRKYRHKVKTTVGNGYTYVLSAKIVEDVMGEVPSTTQVLFYVDNFDPRQDDLRRMMELDGPNRRAMIVRSAEVAAGGRAVFVPSYNHCMGCIPSTIIGDSCELGPKGSVYNARVCDDLQAIATVLATDRESQEGK